MAQVLSSDVNGHTTEETADWCSERQHLQGSRESSGLVMDRDKTVAEDVSISYILSLKILVTVYMSLKQ